MTSFTVAKANPKYSNLWKEKYVFFFFNGGKHIKVDF